VGLGVGAWRRRGIESSAIRFVTLRGGANRAVAPEGFCSICSMYVQRRRVQINLDLLESSRVYEGPAMALLKGRIRVLSFLLKKKNAGVIVIECNWIGMLLSP